MSVQICVHRLTTYRQNWTSLKLEGQTLAINTRNFLSRICSVFVYLKLPQYYISNMHFQFLHFGGVVEFIDLIIILTFSRLK